MAIEDIISEEFETRAPNLEVAQGGPEDFMSEDEMDPYQDPEFQQLLESLPTEQAEVLIQLIKEFKMAVAQGFTGEFEDFVKMKMASAQGSSEDLMTEEEMIIPDEELQSMIPMGQQVAHGGRIRRQGGGIMDVVEEEQVETGPTTQQLIMKWLNDRGLPITPENIQRAIMELSQAGQAPSMPRGEMVAPQMEQPRPPTGALAPGVVGEDISETVTPDIAQIIPRAKPEVFEDVEDVEVVEEPAERNEWLEKGERLKSARGGLHPDSYLYIVDEWQKEGRDRGWVSEEDYLNKWQTPFFGEFGEQRTNEIDRFRDWGGIGRAHGGRAGYQYGNEVTADAPGVRSQVSPSRVDQIQGNRIAEDALKQIYMEFRQRFPEADEEDIAQMIRNHVAETQLEGTEDFMSDDLGILGLDRAVKMITPESVDRSTQAISRHHWQEGGRARYGLGSLVKGIFKGAKKGVKSLVKSVKKFAKSDLGKMALMYIATAGMGNILQPGAASWASPFTKGASTGWLRPGTVLSNYGNLFKGSPDISKAASKLTSSAPITADAAGVVSKLTPASEKLLAAKNAGSGMFSGLLGSFEKNPMPWILGTSAAAGLYTKMNPGKDNLEEMMRNYKGEVADWDQRIADIRAGKIKTPFSTDNITYPYPDYSQYAAEGGRIGRAEGGLMDLGGMEKDYRAEGGFVPIGGKEKADDVPARLSRNEFVFTADAVRNAGGGDVDRGSEVMENIMTNLENGGNISEESQGLEGARDMFEVSERLSEVV
jgi:hypothetical protein